MPKATKLEGGGSEVSHRQLGPNSQPLYYRASEKALRGRMEGPSGEDTPQTTPLRSSANKAEARPL